MSHNPMHSFMEKIDKISKDIKTDHSYIPPHMRNTNKQEPKIEHVDASTSSNDFPALVNEEIKINIKEKVGDVSFAEQASRWKSFEDDSLRQTIRQERTKLDDIYIQQQNPFKNFKKRPTTAFKPIKVEEPVKVEEVLKEEEWTVVNNHKKQRKPKPEKVYTEADFLEESTSENEEKQEEDTYWRNP